MTETAVTAVVYCRVLFTTLDSSAKDRNLTAPTSRPSPASFFLLLYSVCPKTLPSGHSLG